ncbi:MAG: glycosyltransferase, partial [Acidobacteriota bacterium]
ITNCYNSGKYLRANIDSMLRQEYVDWEHIIVDCGSTDDSIKILSDAAHERLRVFRVPFCGVSSGRNIGIERAKGDIIAILDSDDCALPQRLSAQVSILSSMPNIVGVGSGIIRVNEATEGRKTFIYPVSPQQIAILLRAGFNPIPHSSFTFRLSSFKAVGGYSDTIEKGEDFELMLRLTDRGSIFSLPTPLVLCASREDSHTNRHRPKGRDVAFFAALSLILNSIGRESTRPSQKMIEMWLEDIGSDGVGALLGEWGLRSIWQNWAKLNRDSIAYLLALVLAQTPRIVKCHREYWREYSKTPKDVAIHLSSKSSR